MKPTTPRFFTCYRCSRRDDARFCINGLCIECAERTAQSAYITALSELSFTS